ncbi:MAG: sulfatase family protein [Planctomycetota bacterium]|jgi:arylsulfatase A-like enzyme
MKKPNVLLITSDQQHWDTIGKFNPKIKTPNLDRLCNEGTIFKRAYCSNPVCSPSRASIITGLYPSQHHCWTIGVKLPEDVPTVGDIFSKEGYNTTLIGKAHFQPVKSEEGSESIECPEVIKDLDFWKDFHGPWYGFDHVETGRMHADEFLVGQHYALWMKEKGFHNYEDYFSPCPDLQKLFNDKAYRKKYVNELSDKKNSYSTNGNRNWKLPAEYHHTAWIGERTVANIEKSVEEDKPFFLWSSFFDPHPPYLIPEPWASMYDPEDMEIGTLEEGEFDKMPPQYAKTQEEKPDFSMYQEDGGNACHGFSSHLIEMEDKKKNMATYYGMMSFLDEQIGVILDSLDRLGVADNTIILFSTDHGHYLGQHGLTAKCGFYYDDLLRIPMIVRFPGKVPAGKESDALQSQVDFAPTFLNACDIDVPGLMQGVNQLDCWCGKEEKIRDRLVIENRHQPTKVHIRSYVFDRYKITVYRDDKFGELFDLQEDPEERNNLWDAPEAAQIKAELLLESVKAEIQRESTRMPRIAGA